jgi:pyruvate formate lyase activating enzyme
MRDLEGPKGLVFAIMRYALHDGPGLRTTVFLKGCPLSCQWCHNPESQSRLAQLMYSADRCVRCRDCVEACPRHAIVWKDGALVHDPSVCEGCGACAQACPSGARRLAGRPMSASELLKIVSRDIPFFDESGGGVTFSGGEPLMQADFLEAALDACRESAIRTAVDTCGYAPKEVLARISRKADLFLYDLKALDGATHRRFVGVGNELILENLAFLAREHDAVIVRIPIVPGVNGDDHTVERTAELLVRLGLRRVDLLPYHQIGMEKYERLQNGARPRAFEPPPVARMEEIAERFRREGLSVRIGG